ARWGSRTVRLVPCEPARPQLGCPKQSHGGWVGPMFTTEWQTSPRQYGVIVERGVRVLVDEGITLDCDIFRPDAPGRFPVILTASPYEKEAQSTPMVPKAIGFDRA